MVEESEEWKQYEKNMNDFLKKEDESSWKKWKKGHEAEAPERWFELLGKEGYVIGTAISLKNNGWGDEFRKRWEYSDSLCENGSGVLPEGTPS